MSQSIYVTLNTRKVETSVPKVEDKDGKLKRENFGMVNHEIGDILPTDAQFEDADQLLAFFEDLGKVHEALQRAVVAKVIDLRATFKAMPSEGDWSVEVGQKAVDAATWKPFSRPNVKKSDEDVARAYLDSLTPEARAAFLGIAAK